MSDSTTSNRIAGNLDDARQVMPAESGTERRRHDLSVADDETFSPEPSLT
jgi:hypothetical protein